MVVAATHRGPDGEKTVDFTFGDHFLSLGHNLLHVVGKEPTFQPVTSNSSVLIFNGEIYNYLSLAKKYKLKNIASDTTVLHELLEKKGLSCISELNGMFAFVFIDFEKQKICLVRDTFGQKPLYYSTLNGELLISSECRSILATGLVSDNIRREGVVEILQQKHVIKGSTIYEHILEVLPGQIVTLDNHLKSKKDSFFLTATDQKNDLNQLLTDSVSLHTGNINSPALFLSGGLDSALLLHHLKNKVGRVPICYTVDTGKDSSDLSFAKKLVSSYDVPHHIVKADTSNFSSFINSLDSPVGDGAFFLQYELSHAIKKNHKVALSGNGADELFAGYNRHLAYHKFITHKPVLLLLKRLRFLFNLHPNLEKRRLIKKFFESLNENEQKTFRNFYSLNLLSSSKFINNEKFHLEEALNYDLTHYLTQDLLKISDLAGMSAGVEIRSPFLDQSIYNYSTRFSVKQKLSGGTKTLLKELAKKEPLLNSIGQRKKQGFGIPFHSFFKESTRKWIDTSPLREFLSQDQFETIKRVIKEDYHHLSNDYWTLLILTCWLKKGR